MTHIWAHRGARVEAPENTLAAFAAAIDAGADGIELDVHLTADGRLVVHHDETVVLPTGEPALLRDLPYEAVRTIDVGTPGAGVHRIPTLDQVFALLAPTDLTLNVEIKDGLVRYPGIEGAVLAAERGSGMAERIVYSSFNHHTLVALRRLRRGVDIAPLYTEALVEPWLYARRLGARAVHPFHPTLAFPGTFEGFEESGIELRPWTVNDPAAWRSLTLAGVDAIMTDDPRAAVKVRDEVRAARHARA
ncbi:glycerophosphodiester phosphodiesterase family protein [Demequina pelophila]|uniref:glycerophosphodiester phosphodiesterase family protein n=1 Tax=Demequina pelophila TaxID=1638984 RepID=UPI0007861966|nr:glycerophosphodiester phosphodiesterase family protein [Demequina pelophila]